MPESSSSCQQSSLWLSAGLFVVAAVASQLVQNRRRQQERQAAAERRRQIDLEDALLGRRYSMKRMNSDHLGVSKENLNSLVEQEIKDRKTEDNLESGDNVFDFQPKNSNWNHFDMSAELDDEDLSQIGINDDDEEDSTSSEEDQEEFLWTNSSINRGSIRHKGSLSSRSHPNKEQSSWTAKLKEATQRGFRRSIGPTSEEKEATQRGFRPSIGSASEENDEGWLNVEPRERKVLRRQLTEPVPGSIIYRRQSYEPQVQNRVARRRYNARIMPNKVVMIRHGQSMGNINEELYSTTSDNAMPLTKLGWEQARYAGQTLKNQVLPQGETVHFIVSPYVRTVETFHGVVSAWCDPSEFKHIKDRDKRLKAWYGRLLELGLTWHEDPRIREQDFGNYQDPESIKKFKQERHRFGSFFYRFPHGESASDVFDRVSTFLDSLWRSFYLNKSRNYVLITHGISIRVLLARYFRYTIEQFQLLANPKNCEMVILEHDGAGQLQLEGRCEQTVIEDDSGEKHVTGCTFHDRLRVIPSQYVPKAKIRISYDD